LGQARLDDGVLVRLHRRQQPRPAAGHAEIPTALAQEVEVGAILDTSPPRQCHRGHASGPAPRLCQCGDLVYRYVEVELRGCEEALEEAAGAERDDDVDPTRAKEAVDLAHGLLGKDTPRLWGDSGG
jgi:hypothetical protein